MEWGNMVRTPLTPGPADRLMIYLILFISECLTKLAPAAGRPSPSYQEATKQLSTLAVDSFALPGDAGFPLNSLYHPPASKLDAGESAVFMLPSESTQGGSFCGAHDRRAAVVPYADALRARP
jgi:actin related protein 2/3 complex subunit 3